MSEDITVAKASWASADPTDAPTSAMASNAAPASAQPGTGARRSDDRPGVPERVGRYRVLKELGRGGMGSVYLATRDDDQFRKKVALKVIKRGMDTDEIVRRFRLEKEVLAALNHPNIARILDAGATDDGRPFLVMEFIEGTPVSDYADENNLSVHDRLAMFLKICAAVHHAHQNLIIHRDIKPSNIIVGADGEPKLLDFGIAKLLDPAMTSQSLVTTAEMRLMTPEYASPEQVQGASLSTASDVYSLGVLLYELLTGHRPYQFRTRMQDEIVRVVCQVEPDRPSTAVSKATELTSGDGTTRRLNADEVAKVRGGPPQRLKRRLSGDLDNIMLKALRKDAKRRYSTAQQLAEDIERHLNGHPVQARPDTWGYRTTKFVHRNRWQVTAAGVFVGLLAGGVITTTFQAQRAMAAEAEVVQQNVELKDVVSTFLKESRAEIRKLEGARPALNTLARTSTSVLEKLVDPANPDPELRDLLAEGYKQVGDIQLGAREGGDQDAAAALASFRKSVEIRRQLADADPQNPLRKINLAASVIRLGDALAKKAETEAAEKEYAAAIAMLGAVKADGELERDRKRLTAHALQTQGDMLARRNDAAAAGAYQQSLAIRQELANAEPKNVELRRDLSNGYNRAAKSLETAGDLDGALANYRQSLDIRAQALTAEPSGRTKRDVMNAKEDIARVLLAMGRAPEAQATSEDAFTMARALRDADPANGRATVDIVRNGVLLATVQLARGESMQAAAQARDMVTIGQQLTNQDPASAEFAYYTAIAQIRLGEALLGTGDAQQAADAFAAAARGLTKLIEHDPRTGAFSEMAAAARLGAGDALWIQNVPDRAGAEYAAAASTLEELAKSSPLTGSAKQLLADAYARTAVLGVARGAPAPTIAEAASKAAAQQGKDQTWTLRAQAAAAAGTDKAKAIAALDQAITALGGKPQRSAAEDRLLKDLQAERTKLGQ
jgi:serine/threonine protein kinase/tetratricopeptide (TPR) repeat protein